MTQPHRIQVGDTSPNFSLKDQDDRTFDLLEHGESRVLLSFHPLAWTPVCAAQMQSLEENREVFASCNTIAVGISVDSVPCKRAWADAIGVRKTRILADFWPHGEVARLFGIFREANGFSERANIILDEKENVIFEKIYPVHSLPDIQEIIRFLKKE